MNALGIDVGASAVKFGVFTDSSRPLFTSEEKTTRSRPEFKAQIIEIAARMKKLHGIKAVGIGIPGFISLKERIIELSPNMRFLDGLALESELAADIDLPVTAENDANAAALGEFLALKEEPRPDSFVLLTLGSGIGSGIILNGSVWRGAGGFAAELGHLLVNSRGRACGCGNHGCAETESSEYGIVRSYQEYSHSPAPLRSHDVFALLQAGNPDAQKAFERAGTYLGVLFSQIVHFLNPERIAIGGGVAAAGEALLGPARKELERRIIAKAYAGTVIEPARLGNGAGMAGAAALARELLR